jgi:hypothetical protein
VGSVAGEPVGERLEVRTELARIELRQARLEDAAGDAALLRALQDAAAQRVGHQHRRGPDLQARKPAHDLEAALERGAARRRHTEIGEQQEVDALGGQPLAHLDGGFGTLGDENRIAGGTEALREHLANVLLVVHEQQRTAGLGRPGSRQRRRPAGLVERQGRRLGWQRRRLVEGRERLLERARQGRQHESPGLGTVGQLGDGRLGRVLRGGRLRLVLSREERGELVVLLRCGVRFRGGERRLERRG